MPTGVAIVIVRWRENMHTGPVEGKYTSDWKKSEYVCSCGKSDVWRRSWESNCGGFDDTEYECRGCGLSWWVESSDA